MGRSILASWHAHAIAYRFAQATIAALLFAANFWLVFVTTRTSGGMAAIWSANAVLVCAAMGKPLRSSLPYYAGAGAASLLCNLGAGFSPAVSCSYSIANLIEVAITVSLFGRMADKQWDQFAPRNLVRFVCIAAIATFVSATVAIAGRGHFGGGEWLSWFLSDMLGLVLIVPSLQILLSSWKSRVTFMSSIDKTAAYVLVLTVAATLFAQTEPALLFVMAVPVLIAVFAAGPLGAVISTVLVAFIAVVATNYNSGPVYHATNDNVDRMLLLQAFLACQLLITLPVASVLEGRSNDAAKALERERLLRELAEKARHQAERSNRLIALSSARDELTGLATRARIMRKLEQMVERSADRNEPLAIAIFDIDHFKAVNDQLGHAGGDAVLQRVGQIARTSIPRRFRIGRIGGEEFMLLLPGQNAADAEGYAEQLRLAIMAGTQRSAPCRVTISLGLAEWQPGRNIKSMLREADMALYAAKSAGRNRLSKAA